MFRLDRRFSALAAILVLSVSACSTPSNKEESGPSPTIGSAESTPTPAETEADDSASVDQTVWDLKVGDCISPPDANSISSVPKVDCAQPHDAEVYYVDQLADSPTYPGEEAVNSDAEDMCVAHFQEYVGTPYMKSQYFASNLVPSEDSWTKVGDREVICLVTGDTSLTGSVKGTNS